MLLFTLPCKTEKKNDSFAHQPKQELDAARGLLGRILNERAIDFEISLISAENGKDVFEIDKDGNRVVLRGNNGVSIASALNFYLENVAHCDVTPEDLKTCLPRPLPLPRKPIRKVSPYRYRYCLNYCTFSYTMAWWNWRDWEHEIDWMAMKGINMPLALNGQNIIWYRLYRNLGFTDKELNGFFSGPAYRPWFWMGNLDGWDGPLPKSWMIKHEILEKRILKRERSLGMTPVLPAFTGHVPPSFAKKFPGARLEKTRWEGFPRVYLLDPTEPMFTKIGGKFLREEIKIYGTDHLYSADVFNENTPPTNDSTYLSEVSKKVYQSMTSADPKAVWIMQGWMFFYASRFWQPVQMKAVLNAVPDGQLIILDLYSERFPIWNRTKAYYSKPWIWDMLDNFGGRISLYGLMKNVANNPSVAFNDPKSGKMVGIGLTMESLGQNPVMYELMMENAWRNTPINLSAWLGNYLLRRYGKRDRDAAKAWSILKNTVYADSLTAGGPVSVITCLPALGKVRSGDRTVKLPYKPVELLKAWDYLIDAAPRLCNSDGYRFDLVDLTRQVLANYASVIQQRFTIDYKKGNLLSFKRHTQQFINLIEDLDTLLATRKEFLLGRWLKKARSWGTTRSEKNQYEKNARDLITLWGNGSQDNGLLDYACKQWSGLLDGFYASRWRRFFFAVFNSMKGDKRFDAKKFDKQIKKWEWSWVNSHSAYPTIPHGDAVMVVLKMYKKYVRRIREAYRLVAR